MIKKLSLILSVIVFATAITIFAVTFIKSNSRDKSVNKEFIRSIVSRAEQLEKENLYSTVLDQKCYFGKDSTKLIMFRKIWDSSKVFFYFSDKICPPCIVNTIEVIKQQYPNYQSDSSIIFISPDYPKRLTDNCYGKKLLSLQFKMLGLPVEKNDVPFFFRLNNNLEITSIHIVVKVDFDRTKKYLQSLQDL